MTAIQKCLDITMYIQRVLSQSVGALVSQTERFSGNECKNVNDLQKDLVGQSKKYHPRSGKCDMTYAVNE